MASDAIPMAGAADGESTGSPLSTLPVSGALQISTVVPATAAPSLRRLSRSPVVNADGQMFKSTDEQPTSASYPVGGGVLVGLDSGASDDVCQRAVPSSPPDEVEPEPEPEPCRQPEPEPEPDQFHQVPTIGSSGDTEVDFDNTQQEADPAHCAGRRGNTLAISCVTVLGV